MKRGRALCCQVEKKSRCGRRINRTRQSYSDCCSVTLIALNAEHTSMHLTQMFGNSKSEPGALLFVHRAIELYICTDITDLFRSHPASFVNNHHENCVIFINGADVDPCSFCRVTECIVDKLLHNLNEILWGNCHRARLEMQFQIQCPAILMRFFACEFLNRALYFCAALQEQFFLMGVQAMRAYLPMDHII